jgi:type I restriction enzyme M protein
MTSQEMKKTLWEAADKLRAQMDAAEYKHLVLGLIFLKYVSDAFEERRREVAVLLADPASELHFSDDAGEQATALEDRDYYTSANVFWVPQVPTRCALSF